MVKTVCTEEWQQHTLHVQAIAAEESKATLDVSHLKVRKSWDMYILQRKDASSLALFKKPTPLCTHAVREEVSTSFCFAACPGSARFG